MWLWESVAVGRDERMRVNSCAASGSSGSRRSWVVRIVSSASLMLVLEAFFGGGYVSLVKGYTVAMMLDYGFSVRDVSLAMLLSSLGVLVSCYALYRAAGVVEARVRLSLLVLHAGERIAYVSLPFLLYLLGPLWLLVGLVAGEAMDAVVGALLTYYILVLFDERGVRRVTGWRTSAGLVSTLLAHMVAAGILYGYKPPASYMLVYSVAGLLAVASWVSVLLAPLPASMPRGSRGVGGIDSEAKTATVFIVFMLASLAGYLYSLGWQSYLVKSLGAPSYLIAVASLAATATTAAIAPVASRAGYRAYRLLLVVMPVPPLVSLITRSPLACVASVPLFTVSSTIASLAAVSLYKRVEASSMVRLSLKLVAAMALGNTVAMTLTYGLSMTPPMLLAASSVAATAAAMVALVAVEELSPLPSENVRLYARILYQASVKAYYGALDVSATYLRTALRLVVLCILLSILATLYRAAMIISGVG